MALPHHMPSEGREEDSADPLDALLDSYSAQAQAETAQTQRRHADAVSKGRAPSSSARLAKGLAQPLSQDNKGLKMMQSMGYHAGSGLGLQGQGSTAPVPVNIRGGRAGLGVDEAKRAREVEQQREAEERQVKRARQEVVDAAAFAEAARNSFASRQALQQLHQAWTSAEQLLETQKTEQQEPPSQLVLQLTALFPRLLSGGHLSRDQVLHVADRTLPDALQRQSTQEEGTQEDLETSAAAEAVAEMAKAEPGAPQAQLEQLLSYLRSRFYYCYFCGAAYASQEELLQACPGAREEDH